MRHVLWFALLLIPLSAAANSTGITSSVVGAGCGAQAGCHTPTAGSFTMPVPTVTLTPSATSVEVGEPLTLTVVITSPNNRAGLNLSASTGKLTTSDPDAHVLNGEVTHNRAKLGGSGKVTFTASWTAPLAGSANFKVFGNAVNGDGSSTGDNFNVATAGVTVTCSPAPEVCDGVDNDCTGLVDDASDLCTAGLSCIDGKCQAGGGGGTMERGGCSVGFGGPLIWVCAFVGLRLRKRGRSDR
ncbi:MAG: choice-of-anchor V domain-containing protein [Myxococcaceae bacterium]